MCDVRDRNEEYRYGSDSRVLLKPYLHSTILIYNMFSARLTVYFAVLAGLVSAHPAPADMVNASNIWPQILSKLTQTL
jgi:hypothetical protein